VGLQGFYRSAQLDYRPSTNKHLKLYWNWTTRSCKSCVGRQTHARQYKVAYLQQTTSSSAIAERPCDEYFRVIKYFAKLLKVTQGQ